MIKNCKHCGLEFIAKNIRRVFCSDSCRCSNWSSLNPDKCRIHKENWIARNPEQQKEIKKKIRKSYYIKNKEKEKKRVYKWVSLNRDKSNQRVKECLKKNREKLSDPYIRSLFLGKNPTDKMINERRVCVMIYRKIKQIKK